MKSSRNYVLRVAIALLCAIGIHMPSFGYVRNAAVRLSHGARSLRPQVRFQHTNNPESLTSRVERLKRETEALGRSVDSLGRWLRAAEFATAGIVASTVYLSYQAYHIKNDYEAEDIIADIKATAGEIKESQGRSKKIIARIKGNNEQTEEQQAAETTSGKISAKDVTAAFVKAEADSKQVIGEMFAKRRLEREAAEGSQQNRNL